MPAEPAKVGAERSIRSARSLELLPDPAHAVAEERGAIRTAGRVLAHRAVNQRIELQRQRRSPSAQTFRLLVNDLLEQPRECGSLEGLDAGKHLVGDDSQREEIRPVVDQIVVDLQQQGPTLAEVERAKRNIIANQLRTVERIGGFGGKADLLNHYETFLGDPGYLPRDLARYRAVTPRSAQDFAQKYLFPSEHVELDVIPAPKRSASAGGGRQ